MDLEMHNSSKVIVCRPLSLLVSVTILGGPKEKLLSFCFVLTGSQLNKFYIAFN